MVDINDIPRVNTVVDHLVTQETVLTSGEADGLDAGALAVLVGAEDKGCVAGFVSSAVVLEWSSLDMILKKTLGLLFL